MSRQHQRGMTMWGAAFVAFVGAFFLFLLFKLFPVYMEDFKIRNALEGLAREPEAALMSRPELVERLGRRFVIDRVTAVRPNQLRVRVQGRATKIGLHYEVVVPLAYNVSALLEFDHEREIRAAQ